MKLFRFLVLIIIGQGAFAQIKVTRLAKADIPSNIHYSGHLIDAVKFADNDGDHLVLITETGIIKSRSSDKDFDGRDAEIYAYSYKMTGTQQILNWQVHDFEKDCPVDVLAKYVSGAFAVTDLNNDGKAEVWLMYRTACRGDVSPAVMKIIMYEGGKKYAVRGTAKIMVSGKPIEYIGGKYSLDEAFKNAPEVLRQYAVSLWNKNILEKWD